MKLRMQLALAALAVLCSCAADEKTSDNDAPEQAEILPFKVCGDRSSCAPCPDGLCQVHFWPFKRGDGGRLPSARALAPAASHVCVLSGVHGELVDLGVAFGAHRRTEDLGERWFLGGTNLNHVAPQTPLSSGPCPDSNPSCHDTQPICTSTPDGPECLHFISQARQALTQDFRIDLHNNGVGAYSSCVPLSNFQTDQDGVVWTSDIFVTRAAQGDLQSTDMWFGDAASFFTTLGGRPGESADFDKVGDGLFIVQGGPDTPSVLSARDDGSIFANDKMGGAGVSLFVGVPHSGDVPNFFRFGGVEDIETIADSNSSRSIDLDQIDSALCYLTTLQGEFAGDGEWAAVLPHQGADGIWRWRLDVRAGSGSDGINAAARCIKYDQCKHPENGCIRPVGAP